MLCKTEKLTLIVFLIFLNFNFKELITMEQKTFKTTITVKTNIEFHKLNDEKDKKEAEIKAFISSDKFCTYDTEQKEVELKIISPSQYKIEEDKAFGFLMLEKHPQLDTMYPYKKMRKVRELTILAEEEVSSRFIASNDPRLKQQQQ